MLRIAICDDQPRELDIINEYIKEYMDIHPQEAEIQKFSHPDKLLTATESERFHLYILDIVMPMVSGLELGKEIRRLDREVQIIYATTEPQFALQAYAARVCSLYAVYGELYPPRKAISGSRLNLRHRS